MMRLGVAGVGWLGESLIKEVASSSEFQVAAVQDVRLELARHVAQRYDVAWCGDRFEDLVALPDVDAVLICTPNAFHAAQAHAALRAGKDVLVQKPLALSLADAEATLALAARLRRLLFVDYSYRFLETIATFKRALPPKVHSARAVFHNIYGPGLEKRWFFDPRLSGGGALTDLGVHLLDLALWLLQPRQVELVNAALTAADAPVENAARLRLLLDDVDFEVSVSWNAPLATTEIGFEVASADGGMRWENVDGSFFHFRTLRHGEVLLDRETTLRSDTLCAFARAVIAREAPPIDTRVYALLDQAYGRVPSERSRLT
jgi:predicted dehydrogenase